jgi:hypothetical protein
MPKLTTAENIRTRLEQGFDPAYHDRIYNQIRYAFGEPWNSRGAGVLSMDGDFPYYPDVSPKKLEVGRSRRILSSQFINLARTMYTQPEPEFPQVDRFTAEVRKQYWIRRAQGDGRADGDWATQLAMAFLDGDGVGTGFVQIGLCTNPDSGLQKVQLKHVPVVNVIWDRHAKTPSQARWIAFVHHLAPDIAEKLYGSDILKEHTMTLTEDEAFAKLDVVRIVEYYDLGWGKGEPTMAIIPGGLMREPLLVQENTFGCLPFAHYEHVIPPGCNRPIGRIILQMQIQEEINRIERKMSRVSRRSHADIVDVQQVDAKDLEQYRRGDADVLKVKDGPSVQGRRAFERIAAPEVSHTDLQRLQELQMLLDEGSGVTQQDRGRYSAEARTATENRLLDQRSQQQSSWSKRQAAKFYIRAVEKVLHIGRQFDRDPVSVDLFGADVALNDPGEPDSYLEHFLDEPSQTLIDEGAMEFQDGQAIQGMRLAHLDALRDLVQMGIIDPVWFAREKLKVIGEKDPAGALVKRPPAGLPGGAGFGGGP